MSNLFSNYIKTYSESNTIEQSESTNINENYKRDFKRREMEHELRHEDEENARNARARTQAPATKSNMVMVQIDGKNWKKMSLAAAKKAATTLSARGKKVTATYINENQEFDIDSLLESNELTEELLEFMDLVEAFNHDLVEDEKHEDELTKDDLVEDEICDAESTETKSAVKKKLKEVDCEDESDKIEEYSDDVDARKKRIKEALSDDTPVEDLTIVEDPTIVADPTIRDEDGKAIDAEV